MALGAYSGVVAALDARSMDVLFLMRGHSGGVTQVLRLLHCLHASLPVSSCLRCLWTSRHAVQLPYK